MVEYKKLSLKGRKENMKKVLATMLAVCLLFSVMACVAGAATVEVGEIVTNIRVCPGKVIDDSIIAEPSIKGYAKNFGWEIQNSEGFWVEYNGTVIEESQGDFNLRYFVVDYDGVYTYSNVCSVRVAHNPIGDYQYSGTDHWRVCGDCGGQADKGGHDHLSADATAANKVCTVCGHVRTSQYTGILSFMEWFMSLINNILGMFL